MKTSTRIISRRHNVISRGDLRRKALMGFYTFLNVRRCGFRFEYVKSENFLLPFLSFSLKRESKLKRLDSPVSSTPCQARGRLRQAYQVRNDTMCKFISENYSKFISSVRTQKNQESFSGPDGRWPPLSQISNK